MFLTMLLALLQALVSEFKDTPIAATALGAAWLAKAEALISSLVTRKAQLKSCPCPDCDTPATVQAFNLQAILALLNELPQLWAAAQPFVQLIEQLIANFTNPTPAPDPNQPAS